ncbi:PAS domain S-box protein, partial [Candidatus Bathyarchaeota archaeon]|nr:PAS domain S-box protein [Candidatus Bathyarchaeota archaeon]
MQKDASLKGDTIKSENIREAHISLEDKLRNILEKANDCIIFLDKAGRIIDVNRKTLDVFGYSKGEVLGKHFTDLKVLSIKDMPKVMGKFSKILGGKEATLELSIKNKQGRQMLLECSGSIIRTDGKFDGIMIIVRDVTERDQMQNSLQQSEGRYRHLVESIKDVLYSLDTYGNITSVNKAVKTLLGLEPKELIGKNILEFIPKEDLPKVKTLMKQNLNAGSDITEIRIIDKNGRLREVEFSSTPIIKDGKVVGTQGLVRDITKRKKIKEELRLSQERFKILFEYAPDAFYLSDLQGNFIDGNRVTEKLFGYKKKELIGKNFIKLKLISRQDMVKITEILTLNELGKPTGPDEFTLYRKDKKQLVVEMSTFPAKIEGKTVVLGIAHDITKRKNNEKALQDSEEKYRNLFELAPDGIATFNRWGTLQSVNPAFGRLTGFSSDEIVGKNFTKIGTLRAREIPRYLKLFADVMRGKNVPYFEFPYKKKDGTARWAEAHIGILREKGKLTGMLTYLRDTTDRIEAEKSIRENKRKFEQLFMSSPEAAVYVDADFHILDINTRFTDLFGYSLEECLGQHIDNLVVPKEKLRESKLLNRRVREGYTYHETIRQRKDHSQLQVSISSTSIIIEDEAVGYVALYSDITERKKMEKKLKEYSESLEVLVDEKTKELKEAERMAAMGEIAAMVGHDIRNPLTGIAGAVYYLKTKLDPKKDKNIKKMLEIIERNIEYSDKIINDLLDYSRNIHLERTYTTP